MLSIKNIALAGLVFVLIAVAFGTPLEGAVVGNLILLIAISVFALAIGMPISLDPWAGELRRRSPSDRRDSSALGGGDNECNRDGWDDWFGGDDGGGGDGGGGE